METAAQLEERYELHFERKIAAPCDLLFEVWSQPKHIVNWWGPNDFTVPSCEVDFRVGGSYRLCMRSPEGDDHWLHGTYQEIDEPRKIVFTWRRENADGSIWCDTLVSVTFETSGDETIFRLYQRDFEGAAVRDEHRGGWSECIDRLADYVTVPN